MGHMIDITGLSKIYKSQFLGKPCQALSAIDFKVAAGEVFGIIGPNGAGKSTLIKILLDFVRSDKGTVSLGGESSNSTACRVKVGYLPETLCLYRHLTIVDHLIFAARAAGIKNYKERIDSLLEKVKISHASKKPISKYSKGMTQRAALAYALFTEPDILLLDEPMSGLDPLGRQLVVDIIRDYNSQAHTILFCSHVLSDVERICNRIGIMNKGELISIITPAELPKKDELTGNKSPLESFFIETVTSHEGSRQ